MSILHIPLRENQFAIIDEADGPLVTGRSWNLEIKSNSLYVSTPIGRGRNVSFHVFLMNPPEGFKVDHKNGNGLDNRRENLRIVTQSQNIMNARKAHGTTSRFKGVYWESARYTWTAKIKLNQKSIWLGRFKDEEEAARAYNAAAIRLFGEHARLNVLDGEPEPDGGFMTVKHGLKTQPPKPLPVPLPHPTDPDACLIDIGRNYFTAIERADTEEVCCHRWYANIKGLNNVYAVGSKANIGLHVFLMKPPPGMIVDHWFGDKLDNRRSRLRIVTWDQNCQNSPGRYRLDAPYKGIIWDENRGQWRAMITINRKSVFLGRYDDATEAARVYDEAASQAFGEFARLNGV